MNPVKEKRLSPCQGSDAYIQRKEHFIRLLHIFTLVWLALGVLHFLRA